MSFLFQTRNAFLLTLFVSISALGAAYVAQFGFGLKPCELCLVQRVPYAGLILASLAALFITPRKPKSAPVFFVILILLFLVISGAAFFHFGVEQHWWVLGEQGCKVGELKGKTEAEILAEILSTPQAKCDEVGWKILGFSITIWNTALSLVMAVYLSLAALKKHAA